MLRIENQVYPRPWSLGLFMSELAMRTGRIYLVARVGPTVVGYAGLLFSLDDGHVTTIAVDPAVAPAQDRHPAARALRATSIAAVPRTSRSRCG